MVDEILPPPPPEPPTESAWERGLRHAKEVRAQCVLGGKAQGVTSRGQAQQNRVYGNSMRTFLGFFKKNEK